MPMSEDESEEECNKLVTAKDKPDTSESKLKKNPFVKLTAVEDASLVKPKGIKTHTSAAANPILIPILIDEERNDFPVPCAKAVADPVEIPILINKEQNDFNGPIEAGPKDKNQESKEEQNWATVSLVQLCVSHHLLQ